MSISRLSRAIEKLPLDIRTNELLMRVASAQKPLRLEHMIAQFESTREPKQLENIIHELYFRWNNELPEHLKRFRRFYAELRDHWPYERHRALLAMSNPRETSVRYLWVNKSSVALENLQLERHGWALQAQPYCLSNLGRSLVMHEIFHHCLFLKRSPRLCKNRKEVPIPIVEIPLNPLGHDIPDVRIRNLFRRKVAETFRLLAEENPPLSDECEKALRKIIECPQPANGASSRQLRRLYQRSCRGAYTVHRDPQVGLNFIVSPLLKDLI
ncbi:LAMI_0H15654g1_1 [Lachancea mirantina]|uniref:Genetic interactor of prohibitin 5, mitochondrial n=1 Tax=Lachancea mirantina TaxID=1230905 RepID=A0A1G4KIS6_9SACH|nr:LAMI_0H15654g1_1 [Lachancea mirantina]